MIIALIIAIAIVYVFIFSLAMIQQDRLQREKIKEELDNH